MKLTHIEIDNLKISPLNVRKHGETNGDDLVPSIRALGVLQPLLVRPNCEGFEVIAGQRRFRACQRIAEDGGIDPLPCIVMDDSDDAAAIEASLAENIARLPMDELDQFEAFRDLTRQGRSIEEIAAHFGVTERLVKQRLAIANLYTPILNAYRRQEIDGSTMRILTLATTRQQKTWFRLFKSEEDYAPIGYPLKDWLFGGDRIPTENALFDLESYSGVIITDLFEEQRYFADAALFWEYQSRTIAQMIEDYREDGWSDVILLDVGEQWSSWEHVDTAKEYGGKVYIHTAKDGQVTPYEGQLSRADIKKREKVEHGEEKKVNERSELTKSMQNYLALHRHAAVRAELLAHQGIALRLAVAQIIAGSGLWQVYAEPQKANTEAIKESLESNLAEDLFAEERETVRGLLRLDDEAVNTSITLQKDDWGGSHDLVAVFAKLLELDDESVTRILTFVVAETLPANAVMVEVLGNLLAVDMADHWKPNQTFFDLLKDKEAINAMVAEVAGSNAAAGNLTATAKVQKGIVQSCLSGERKAKVRNWQPRYMAFPMQSYTERGGIEVMQEWMGVKEHFKAA